MIRTYVFRYKCSKCEALSKFRYCPKCGDEGTVVRVPKNETLKKSLECRTDILMRDNERWSDSLGVNPEQIPEFKRVYGDLMEFDRDGRCLVKNRHHKKKLMKARGMIEFD